MYGDCSFDEKYLVRHSLSISSALNGDLEGRTSPEGGTSDSEGVHDARGDQLRSLLFGRGMILSRTSDR